MGFSRQEDWSGLPCPPPGNRPEPEVEAASSVLQVDSLPLSHQEASMLQIVELMIRCLAYELPPVY